MVCVGQALQFEQKEQKTYLKNANQGPSRFSACLYQATVSIWSAGL